MLDSSELKSLLILNRISTNALQIPTLLKEFSPAEILEKIEFQNWAGKSEALKKALETYNPEKDLERCQKHQVELITLLDEKYPASLREIPVPPIVLYVKGRIIRLDEAAIAIVGTRHPSLYGRNQAIRFSTFFADHGLTVVSGFAQGIDQAAHEAAVSIPGGRSIGVLGSGLDVLYPRGSEELFEKIMDHGAVMSEFCMGTQPHKENFPRRNRIISGLSWGVLVVEAHERSGSLITAHEAVEQGRDVFAIPGPIDQVTSRGSHKLIKEGAFLVENPEDVIDVLKEPLKNALANTAMNTLSLWENTAHKKPTINLPTLDLSISSEEATLENLLKEQSYYLEELAERSAISEGKLALILMQMECAGKIQKKADGQFFLLGNADKVSCL